MRLSYNIAMCKTNDNLTRDVAYWSINDAAAPKTNFWKKAGCRQNVSWTPDVRAMRSALSKRNRIVPVLKILDLERNGLDIEGGKAIARTLYGEVNPSGRLPALFPKSDDQLGEWDVNAKEVKHGLFHGYRYLDHNYEKALYPFGFWLSYTE